MVAMTESQPGAVRCIVLLKRKAGITRDAFNDYWLRVHGEIARGYPNVIRYSQLHITETSSETGSPADFGVDGIVDFVFQPGMRLGDLKDSEIGRRGMEDAKEFIDSLQEIYVQEFNIVDEINESSAT